MMSRIKERGRFLNGGKIAEFANASQEAFIKTFVIALERIVHNFLLKLTRA